MTTSNKFGTEGNILSLTASFKPRANIILDDKRLDAPLLMSGIQGFYHHHLYSVFYLSTTHGNLETVTNKSILIGKK